MRTLLFLLILNIGQNRTDEPWQPLLQAGNCLPLSIHKDLRKFHCVVSLTSLNFSSSPSTSVSMAQLFCLGQWPWQERFLTFSHWALTEHIFAGDFIAIKISMKLLLSLCYSYISHSTIFQYPRWLFLPTLKKLEVTSNKLAIKNIILIKHVHKRDLTFYSWLKFVN